MKELKTKQLHQFLSEHDITDNFSKYNMSNLFSVVEKGNLSYFNICKTINIYNIDAIPQSYYTKYKVTIGDSWTNISYRFYNNIKLWWLICKFNDIKNPFQQLQVGKILKIPTKQLVNQIVMTINS